MQLFPADIQDAPLLAALVNSAYRGQSSEQGWTTESAFLNGQRTDAELLAEFMQKPNCIMLRHQAQTPLGCVQLEKREDLAYLGMLTVSPLAQARGIGSQLLTAAEQWAAQEWGVSKIEITVISLRQELIAWYGRRGYIDTGKRSAFPSDNPRLGILKVPSLTFAHFEKLLPQD